MKIPKTNSYFLVHNHNRRERKYGRFQKTKIIFEEEKSIYSNRRKFFLTLRQKPKDPKHKSNPKNINQN